MDWEIERESRSSRCRNFFKKFDWEGKEGDRIVIREVNKEFLKYENNLSIYREEEIEDIEEKREWMEGDFGEGEEGGV